MRDCFAILTPPLPAALGLIRVWGEAFAGVVSPQLPLPGEAPKLMRFGDVDEGLVVADGEACWLLTPHGGAGVAEALRDLFARAGIQEVGTPSIDEAFAEGLHAHARQALALLPTVRGGSGRRLLLEAIERNAADAQAPDTTLWPSVRPHMTPPRVVLLGAPNAGKSTLFNALASSADAIVHGQAGTTRDLLHAEWELPSGELIDLYDSPGLRGLTGAPDPSIAHPERVGMGIGLRFAAQADALIVLVAAGEAKLSDALDERMSEVKRVLAESDQQLPAILPVISQLDARQIEGEELAALQAPPLSLSAATGEGLDALGERLREMLFPPLPKDALLPLHEA